MTDNDLKLLEEVASGPFDERRAGEIFDPRFRRVLGKLRGVRTVLEVGCGTGKFALYLMGAGYRVDIMDHDRSFLERFAAVARTRMGKSLGTDYRFLADDIEQPANLPVNGYDAVVACEVIEHIGDYRAAVNNMVECATDRVVLTTPYLNTFYSADHLHKFDYHHFDFVRYQTAIEKSYTKPVDVEKGKQVLIISIDVTDEREAF